MPWFGEIILDRVADPKDPRLVEIGDLTFFVSGECRLENRAFPHGEPIDYYFSGNHAFREKKSRRLTVWTASGERFVFEFRNSLSGGRWIRWTPRAVDDAGTPDPDAKPSAGDAAILSLQDLWANLSGLASWLLIGFAIFGIVRGCTH
jgi:hypothetical protein